MQAQNTASANLTQAMSQWQTRPADQRYWDLDALLTATREHKDRSAMSRVPYASLRAVATDGQLRIVGKSGRESDFTHYSFGQVCARTKAPADYLRRLPAELAAMNLNQGLAIEGTADLLFSYTPGDQRLSLRCALSEAYSRIWDADIVERLMDLPSNGWRVPPARPAHHNQPGTRRATAADVLRHNNGGGGISVKVGDFIAPAGLYASDRDLFVFMVNEGGALTNPLDRGTPLNRGFFLSNSEVGDRAFTLKTFLYDAVCGNHIVWGATDVKEARIVHLGHGADSKAWGKMRMTIREYANGSAREDQARIVKAQTFSLGATKDDVLTKLFGYIGSRNLPVTKSQATEAYDIASRSTRYGAPNTPWAITQGLTEISQRSEHANEREKLDRAAGKILEIAF